MFESAAAFDTAAKDDLCAAVERAKAARGVTWSRDPDSPFGQCPVPSAQTIWLGSSDGQYLDRLTIAIAPYEIGPYVRSEEHTSELQSLMRISYAVFCLKKKKQNKNIQMN